MLFHIVPALTVIIIQGGGRKKETKRKKKKHKLLRNFTEGERERGWVGRRGVGGGGGGREGFERTEGGTVCVIASE